MNINVLYIIRSLKAAGFGKNEIKVLLNDMVDRQTSNDKQIIVATVHHEFVGERR